MFRRGVPLGSPLRAPPWGRRRRGSGRSGGGGGGGSRWRAEPRGRRIWGTDRRGRWWEIDEAEAGDDARRVLVERQEGVRGA